LLERFESGGAKLAVAGALEQLTRHARAFFVSATFAQPNRLCKGRKSVFHPTGASALNGVLCPEARIVTRDVASLAQQQHRSTLLPALPEPARSLQRVAARVHDLGSWQRNLVGAAFHD
jgi:hypothetical protein